ncbi:MAG TPA: hypothetical protein VKY80_12765 [Croceibacterium sp.]|nr:hypothetical protein [Croceibacterium sp.]
MNETLDTIVATYADTKAAFIDWTGATEDLLHMHAGLAIFVLSAWLLKKKMRSPVPLSLVAFFAVLNEVFDWSFGGSPGTLEPVVDILNTVFWPTVLFLLARRWR